MPLEQSPVLPQLPAHYDEAVVACEGCPLIDNPALAEVAELAVGQFIESRVEEGFTPSAAAAQRLSSDTITRLRPGLKADAQVLAECTVTTIMEKGNLALTGLKRLTVEDKEQIAACANRKLSGECIDYPSQLKKAAPDSTDRPTYSWQVPTRSERTPSRAGNGRRRNRR